MEMKRIWMKSVLFLLLTAGVITGSLSAEAAVNVDGGKVIFLSDEEKYRCDLNKDGRKETIECFYNYGAGKDLLYINGALALSVNTKSNDSFWIMDLNKKDRYLDLYVNSTLPGKSVFYRYNGKKLTGIAVGLYGDGKIFKSMPAETQHWDIQPGNGIYSAYMALGGFSSSQGYGGYIPIQMKFGIKNKKMIIQTGMEHELAARTTLNGAINYSIAPKVTKTLIAYNKPALKGVKVAFTLKKGDSYMYQKIRFSTPYSFIQIKNLKTGKTGWVGIKTSQLKLASDVVR